MKAFILPLAFFSVSAGGYAEEFAYVDTHYITEQMPQYKSAQHQLDTLVKRWQEEIEAAQKEIEQLQVKRFGPDGEVLKQQKILLKPTQNTIWQAVQRVAKSGAMTLSLTKAATRSCCIATTNGM